MKAENVQIRSWLVPSEIVHAKNVDSVIVSLTSCQNCVWNKTRAVVFII